MKDARQAFQFSFNTWHPQSANQECRTYYYPLKKDVNGNRYSEAHDPSLDGSCSIKVDDYDFDQAYGPNIHGSLVVWQRASANFGFVYGMAEKDYLRAYKVYRNGRVEERAALTTEGASNSPPVFNHDKNNGKLRSPDGMPGAALSLSSNGDSGAVLWVSLAPAKDATISIQPGILMAFDALTLKLLWYDRDDYTTTDKKEQFYFAKFVPPTIAGGRVFRATFGGSDHVPDCTKQISEGVWPSCGSVVVYGLKQNLAPLFHLLLK